MTPTKPLAALGARLAAAAALLLGGCALRAPAPPPPGAVASAAGATPVTLAPLDANARAVVTAAPAAMPDVTGPINGIYQGREQEAGVTVPACPPSTLGLIEIGDGTLLFPYTSGLIYVVAVSPDGKLHETIADAVLDGQLLAGNLDFSVTTADCKSTFAFRRRPGF